MNDSLAVVRPYVHDIFSKSSNHSLRVCSRWEEAIESVQTIADMADAASTPLEIRFVNGFEPLIVGDATIGSNAVLVGQLSTEPSGLNPICKQIRGIARRLKEMEIDLRDSGKIALLIICSDGESTDGNIVDVLRPLEGMPLQIIVRLCAHGKEVDDYWKNITAQLNLDIFVLNRQKDEAVLIAENNSWLVYGEALHRLREFGVMDNAIDLLRYRQLSKPEIVKVSKRL